MPTTPIVKSAIADFLVTANSASSTLNLFDNFDDPFTTGLVATFQLHNTSLGNGGTTNVVLFDQAGEGSPSTVQNFLNYVNSGAYTDSFIHRSASNFVIQGGGFTVDGFDTESFASLEEVTSNAPLVNDYSANRPNRRGTIAFAKIADNPDSATNQWFFNLGDNTSVLGPRQNDGFSVFGEVVSNADLIPVDTIAGLPRFSLSNVSSLPLNIRGALTETPFITNVTNGFSITDDDDFVRYQSITVNQQQELTFEVVSNSNPNVVSVNLNNDQLELDYQSNQTGFSDITVRATNLQGISVDQDFFVQVYDPNQNIPASISWDTVSSVVSAFRLDGNSLNTSARPIGRTIEDTNWKLQTTGDFNGDGQDDVLLRQFAAGQNLVWYMQPGGGAIASESLIGRDVPDPNWSLSGTGDFDGDGKTDIILRNETADQIVAWYMNDDGTIKGESLIGRGFGDNNWKIEATADFNGDGKTDIVLRNALAGQNLLWTMDGANILGEALIGRDVPGAEWQIEAARDFNSDGIVDLFWRHTVAGQGLLWTMASPTQIAQEQLLSGVPDGASQIVF